MNMTRRDVLKSALTALGFAALPGGRLFAAPEGWKRPEKANLVFGVISDTHLKCDATFTKPGLPVKYYAAALRYFRSVNVDAVVNCGDMADNGKVCEMQFHANIWNKVFPGNKAPDGHIVEKLLIAGNHDTEGFCYGVAGRNRIDRLYPDPVEATNHVLAGDMAAHWERIWGEKYERVWHKEVKGYHFFGRHWDVDNEELEKVLVEATAKGVLPKAPRPFFLLSHGRPVGLAKSSCDLRNAMAFFGHLHRSASNWNNVMFFRGCPVPCIQTPALKFHSRLALGRDRYITKAQIEGAEAVKKGYQGYVVRVYDDMVAIERREFSEGGTLGPDWVMPLGEWKMENGKCKIEEGDVGEGERPSEPPHPLSREVLVKKIGEPQFRDGAKPVVEASGGSVKLSIPLADGNPDSRVYAYEVSVTGTADAGQGDTRPASFHTAVYATGLNMGIGHEPNGGVTTLEIPGAKLPPGDVLTVSVCPLSSLGTKGRHIAVEIKKGMPA